MNNNFLIATKHIFSQEYNGLFHFFFNYTNNNIFNNKLDKSILENYHLASVFKLMNENSNVNIFKNLDKEDYIKSRSDMISMILATDMANHFSDSAKMKGRLATSGLKIFKLL